LSSLFQNNSGSCSTQIFRYYKDEFCLASYPLLACRVGEVSARGGFLNIDNKPFFFTMLYLPLQGDMNVIGR